MKYLDHKATRIMNRVAFVATLGAAMLGIIGMALTGFYPGIIVLFLLTLIPMVSRSYMRANAPGPDGRTRKMTALLLLNLLVILVALWMSFVIVHDRVLQDCC